jgi:hypothetical protein
MASIVWLAVKIKLLSLQQSGKDTSIDVKMPSKPNNLVHEIDMWENFPVEWNDFSGVSSQFLYHSRFRQRPKETIPIHPD